MCATPPVWTALAGHDRDRRPNNGTVPVKMGRLATYISHNSCSLSRKYRNIIGFIILVLQAVLYTSKQQEQYLFFSNAYYKWVWPLNFALFCDVRM